MMKEAKKSAVGIRHLGPRSLVFTWLAAALLVGPPVASRPPSTAATQFITVDGSSQAGRHSSMQLNRRGYPVISYHDAAVDSLMLARCEDPLCSSATITEVDANFSSPRDTALALDSGDFPLIAYVTEGEGLRFVACEDEVCSTTAPVRFIDNPAAIDFEVSMAVNSSGVPVISYHDAAAEDLRLAVCGDRTCATSPLSTVDDGSQVGRFSSLALNAIDAPVISYVTGEGGLRVAVCGDASCSSPVVRQLGSGGFGQTAVVIGALGRTFIAHQTRPAETLGLVVCNDALCTDLGFATVDDSEISPTTMSMVLDDRGLPVIGYRSTQEFEEAFRVAICNDAACFDPVISRAGPPATEASLALDARGKPMFSYRGVAGLELAVCPACLLPSRETVDGPNDVGTFSSLALDSRGRPVISYYDADAGNPMLAVCSDRRCSSSSVNTVDDRPSSMGFFTALAVDADDHPAISYWNFTDPALELALCHDPACSAPPTLVTVDDSSDSIGLYSSIVLNANGLPVISYYDETNTALKVAVCNDAACSNPSRNVVDGAVDVVGSHTSLVLNQSGFPVVSYLDQTKTNIKVAVCLDALCASSSRFDVGFDLVFDNDLRTSIALDSRGLPVVSYHDEQDGELRLTVCNNSDCSSRTITTVDRVGSVGRFSSLGLTADDHPVISYFDATEQNLKVAICGDTTCEDPTVVTVAGLGDVGEHSSMKLDSSGFPIISYHAASPDEDLRVAVLGSSLIFADGFESRFTFRWSAQFPPAVCRGRGCD